jgi:undecaprenyl-diphosphatase
MLGAAAVAGVAYALIAPLWHLAGSAVTRWAIVVYRKLLVRPIDLGWLRR